MRSNVEFPVVFLVVPACLLAAPAPAIVNGYQDTSTFECVGSLHDLSSSGLLCSGTLITDSWVLTSAMCALLAPNAFLMGRDWNPGGQVRAYPIDFSVHHWSYAGGFEYDFGLAHLDAPAAGEPTCGLQAAPDDLSEGAAVTHVGYGLISYPDGHTTERHYVTNTISLLSDLHLIFVPGTPFVGPCFFDEGGPAISLPESLVAGVISSIDGTCSEWALSGRVSAVYDSFIVPVVTLLVFLEGFESGDLDAWSDAVP
jgi:hypothetical protein